MKFRIGAKLAISAGIGILFVGAMVINQQMADSADEQTRVVSDRAQKVFNEVKDSEVAFQRIRVAYRDVKLARDPAGLDKVLGSLRRAKQGDANLANAMRLQPMPTTVSECRRARRCWPLTWPPSRSCARNAPT